MSESIAVASGKLGANIRFAKYSKAEIKQQSAAGRVAARTKLEAAVIADYNLDPSAPDFAYRLQQGISAHYRRLRLGAKKAAKRTEVSQ